MERLKGDVSVEKIDSAVLLSIVLETPSGPEDVLDLYC